MEKYTVKPKAVSIIKSAIIGITIFVIAQFLAVQFLLADELILNFWQELFCMLFYLGLCSIAVPLLFDSLKDASSSIEVNGNDLIIKKGYGHKEKVKITEIGGYEIETINDKNEGTSDSGTANEERNLTIYYNGTSITVNNKYFENYDRLEQFVYEKRHKNNRVRNYKQKFGIGGLRKSRFEFAGLMMVLMIGITFLMGIWMTKDEMFTMLALFIYPIIIAYIIFKSNGFLEFIEVDNEKDYEGLTPVILLLFLAGFLIIMQGPYFLIGKSHMRNVYVMGMTTGICFLGAFVRCVIRKKRRSFDKNVVGLLISTICTLVLIELSCRGAGMVLSVKEPYYETAEIADQHISRGGKPSVTSHYISVRLKDGTDKHFSVSRNTYYNIKGDTVKIKSYDSILGYKVQFLEGAEP